MRSLCVVFLVLTASARAFNVPNFAPADLVLGQPNFTAADLPATPSAASLDRPSAVVVDAATGRVFVADTGNNRILRYANAATLLAGAAAEAVFGQADFAANGAGTVAGNTLDSPTGLWIDAGGRLWVADSDNNRVVMYANAATTGSTPAAALVLGQPNSDDETAVTSQAGMSNPAGVCVDAAGRLWVVDNGNNRVLRFDNAAGKATGGNADAVLGQQQFGPGNSSAGTSAQQLSDPIAVTMDANATLWVADRGNNRVLGYPSAGTVSSGTNAARILGQPDFNGSVTAGTTASLVSAPSGVFADAVNNLWVLDQANHRVLRFANLKSLENGRPASAVIGQPNFTSSATALDARHVDGPLLGLFVQPNARLWVGDRGHHRVLRFAARDDQPPTVRIEGKPRRTTTKARLKVRGTATDDVAVTRITIKIGPRKAGRARGTARWSKSVRLVPGRNVVSVRALDATGRSSRKARVVITRE